MVTVQNQTELLGQAWSFVADYFNFKYAITSNIDKALAYLKTDKTKAAYLITLSSHHAITVFSLHPATTLCL